VIKLGAPAYAMAAASDLKAALASEDPGRKSSLIRILGGAPPEMAAALLAPSLGGEDPAIVNAAIHAAGRSRATGLLAEICGLLGQRLHRRTAAETLRVLGDPAVDHLVMGLQGNAMSTLARQAAVQILGASRRADVAPPLLALLDQGDGDLARRALRALNRLRNSTELTLEGPPRERVVQLVENEIQGLYRTLLYLSRGSWGDLRQTERPDQLLEVALHEHADVRVEQVFRLLALCHDPRDLYAAYLGVRSPLKSIRASSVEFLDNVLPKELAATLLPVLESAGAARFAEVAKRVAGLKAEDRVDLVRRLLRGSDPWLRDVAARTVGVDRLEALRPDLDACIADDGSAENPELIRAVQRLDSAEEEVPTMGTTTIEKALELQKADVLQRASIEDLVHVAQITTEEQFPAETLLYQEGDAPDALFVIISGKVRLHRGDTEIGILGAGETFGGWALVDESPRVASATTLEQTTLLKVSREDFLDVLSDRVDIVQAVFKAMVERLRNLASVAE
jgi:DNA-binding phage protein